MSIRIYPVDPQIVSARLGLRMQLDALAPFPSPREHAAPWGFDRDPFMHLLPPFVYGRTKFDLGEEIPSDLEAAPEIERVERAPAAARLSSAPETLSWALDIAATGTVGFAQAISTPAIPWPWQIYQLAIQIFSAVANTYQFQVFATDVAYDEISQTTSEEALITPLRHPEAVGAIGLFGPIIRHEVVAGTQFPHTTIATGPIGRRALEAGKRLTFASLAAGGGVAQNVVVQITVQRADGLSAAPRTAPAPRVTAPRAIAPAPAAVLTGIEKAQAEVRARQEAAGVRVRFIGTFSTPQQATEIANILREKGETARAKVFDDAARRMGAGLALTPEQEQNLALGSTYAPRVTRVSFQRPSGAAAAVYEQLKRSQSDLG